MPTQSSGLVNLIKPCTGQPEELTKRVLELARHPSILVPGQAPLRFAILAELGLPETRDATGNLRAVGR
jgi:hypothetical protein